VTSVSGLALDFVYGLVLDFGFGVHPTFYFCTVCTVSATHSGIF
jgi:hypothetical protein